jgi:hypothetical protein
MFKLALRTGRYIGDLWLPHWEDNDRVGNMLLVAIIAMRDWEMTTVGDPLMDLGAFHRIHGLGRIS